MKRSVGRSTAVEKLGGAADGEATQVRQAVDGRPVVWGNPVTGFRNAIAPPLVMHEDAGWRCGGASSSSARRIRVRPVGCTAVYSRWCSTSILGEAASDGLTKPLFTGTITLRYLRGTPLGRLRAEAAIERTDGIKTFVSGSHERCRREDRRGRGNLHQAGVGAGRWMKFYVSTAFREHQGSRRDRQGRR